MTLWKKNELLEALAGDVLQHILADDVVVDEVLIDGRKSCKNGLFVALKGENHDAHEFLDQAFASGSVVALLEKLPTNNPFLKNFILVSDTFLALNKLAKFARQRTQAKIIALTGSVGKTTTKEMLKIAFQTQSKTKEKTFATSGNLNNHIGLPLSLCNLARDCEFGIFEMGMNHAGEIEPLSSLAQPDLAMITNVGPVHIEFFKNEEGIAAAKSEIFVGLKKDGVALINADNAHHDFLKRIIEQKNIKNHFSFGEKNSSDYQILSYEIKAASLSKVKAKLKSGKEISYEISSTNSAAIFNSIAVVACLDLLGNDLAKGLLVLKNFITAEGRGKISEVVVGKKSITIIDDTYNASVLSMKAGLNYVSNLKKILGKKRSVIALGDMFELGEKSDSLHDSVVKFANDCEIDFAIFVGERMSKSAEKLFKKPCKFFANSEIASFEIEDLLQDGDIFYVKGSRGMRMEKLLKNLIKTSGAH